MAILQEILNYALQEYYNKGYSLCELDVDFLVLYYRDEEVCCWISHNVTFTEIERAVRADAHKRGI